MVCAGEVLYQDGGQKSRGIDDMFIMHSAMAGQAFGHLNLPHSKLI